MFEEIKRFLLIEIPFCQQNEIASKTFLKEIHAYTSHGYDIAIKWITKKVSSLFPLKSKNLHPSCKVYKGECKQCGVVYVGETKRNVEILWNEHNNPK